MGVRFVALTDNFDTLHAERTDDGYIVPLKNMLNEMYSRDMSKKVGTALAEKRKRGELTGAVWAVYGYRKCADDPHKIEPDEETAPVVQEMFRMRADGMSYYKIVQELNRRGIPAPSRYHYLKGDTKCARYADVVWQPQVARRILCNEVYLGHMVQGGAGAGHFMRKNSGIRCLNRNGWLSVIRMNRWLMKIHSGLYRIWLRSRKPATCKGLGSMMNLVKSRISCGS